MNANELIELLRALARCEHSDTSIAEEAADALEAAQAEIEALHEQLRLATVDRAGAEAEANNSRVENNRLQESLVAQQPAEQHPDDAAVDRFAAAMKAKLNKKRQEGRGGWQSMTAEQLSALLHEHVRKGDPVDVANLAMMLHQNGQVIEPPATVVTDELVEALRAEVDVLRDALREAQTRIAAIGYPASPDGKYNKNGEWTFSDAVPRAVDAKEVESAFLVIRTALAAYRKGGKQ